MSRLFLHRVTKRFGGVSAVNGLSLEFEGGKISAVIGPNGAGKTTVFNLIGGQLSLTEGRIFHDDVEISNKLPWQIAKLGVGRMFQDARVFQKLSVRNNVMVAFPQQAGENALWSLFARRGVKRQERVLNRQADKLLAMVELSNHAHRLAGELSFGQQKLLAIARLLASKSNVLLLDEPTAGVNQKTAEKILKILRQVAEQGKTVVVIEHNMNIVSNWADIVYFMESGRVRVFGEPDSILERSDVRNVYLGVEAS